MLRYLTAGESHGPQLTAIIDGLPSGLPVDKEQINFQLSRRQKGYGRGARMKIEHDHVEILSGVRNRVTLGGPITLVIRNLDSPNWSGIMDPDGKLSTRERNSRKEIYCPRPGHADLAGGIKWNHYDLRNVLERASARETAARVALGALVRQLLEQFDIDIASHVVQIGAVKCSSSLKRGDLKSIQGTSEKSQVRCLDSNTSKRMIAAIDRAAKNGDTLGGIVEIIFRGLPIGLGSMSQWDQRLDSRLAAALMSIPSVKGVEFGQGFQTASKLGSQVQDQIFYNRKGTVNRKGFFRKTNHAGGIEGGITNGEDVIIRIASKPLSTLQQPLNSINVKTKQPAKAVVERSDTCIVPALAVVGEAMGSLILADTFLSKFGGDSLSEIKRNYISWLKTPY